MAKRHRRRRDGITTGMTQRVKRAKQIAADEKFKSNARSKK